MTTHPYSNGNEHTSTLLSAGLDEADIHDGLAYQLEEGVNT